MKMVDHSKKVFMLTELERKRKSVEQLQVKLESYLHEPQTYDGFEKKENLKTELNRTAIKTDSLLTILKANDISLFENIDNIERQFKEFNSLHHQVTQYFNQTKVDY